MFKKYNVEPFMEDDYTVLIVERQPTVKEWVEGYKTVVKTVIKKQPTVKEWLEGYKPVENKVEKKQLTIKEWLEGQN